MKQKTVIKVLKVSDKTLDEMVKYYNDYKRDKTPDYAILQAIDGDSVVTIYNSKKVVFQGKDADLASMFWIETEKINSGEDALCEKKEKQSSEFILPNNISSVGSDEVGTGDYFGPIVVTASYVDKKNISFLKELRVKDSKKLTDKDILEIVPKIIKVIPYNCYILSNSDYNKFYGDNMNMNKIKAILHNKVLLGLLSENNYLYDYIVIDQFEAPHSFYNHIKECKNKISGVTFVTKGEDKCLSVAVSSLISRYVFLKEMDKMSKSLGMVIPKGAGDTVTDFGKKIIDLYGYDKLKEIAKLNFKNTDKLLNK